MPFGRAFLRAVRHLLENYIIAGIIIGFAIGFAELEIRCASRPYPAYLLFGLRTIAVVLFIFDGIFACGATGILAFKLLRKLWKNDNDEE